MGVYPPPDRTIAMTILLMTRWDFNPPQYSIHEKREEEFKLREPNSEAREAIYMCGHCDAPICNCPTEECDCYNGEYCSKCEHNPKYPK